MSIKTRGATARDPFLKLREVRKLSKARNVLLRRASFCTRRVLVATMLGVFQSSKRYFFMVSIVRSFLYTSLDTSCAIIRDLAEKKEGKNRDCRRVRICATATNRYLTKRVHNRGVVLSCVKGRVKDFIGDQKACRCLASKRRNKC